MFVSNKLSLPFLFSRKPQDLLPPHSQSIVQHSNTDPSLKKSKPNNKLTKKLNLTKQQQIKKFEDFANKYKEKNKSEEEMNSFSFKNKSHIPLLKKVITGNQQMQKQDKPNMLNRQNKNSEVAGKIQTTNKRNTMSELSNTSTIDCKTKLLKTRQKNHKDKLKMEAINITKNSTMSLDSLEDGPPNSIVHSVGINTELLCVPCVIHDNLEPKNILSKNIVRSTRNGASEAEENIATPKIEILYTNTTMTSSSDVHIVEKYNSQQYPKEELSYSNDVFLKYTTNSTNDADKFSIPSYKNTITDDDNKSAFSEGEVINKYLVCINNHIGSNSGNDVCNLSIENIEESYEHDLSEDFDDSIENKSDCDHDCHGSGETYTKFTENPADLEEFMNLTDQMLQNIGKQCSSIENTVVNLHTPSANSIEAINENTCDSIKAEYVSKHLFSPNFEELKNNLKELLEGATSWPKNCVNKEENSGSKINTNDCNVNKNINKMEHISVYELNFYDNKSGKNICTEVQIAEKELKLPSIQQNKFDKRERYSKHSVQGLLKTNKKYKMLAEESRARKKYQTFIINDNNTDYNSDTKSISSEAPPLKLPRIENKRSDYFPYPFLAYPFYVFALFSLSNHLHVNYLYMNTWLHK